VEFGKPGEPEMLFPKITQETLAQMTGTARFRVSFFMNRFRKPGFIEYNRHIKVYNSLLNVILHDQVSEQNAVSLLPWGVPRGHSNRPGAGQLG
jgi:hypothetical protein